MTVLEGPALRAPEGWSFSPSDLADFGVTFAPEQFLLYDDAQHYALHALAVGFPANPEPRYSAQPLFTMDELDNEQIVAVPIVISLSPAHAPEALATSGPEATRFPSLPGRRVDPTFSRETGPDVSYLTPSFHRLWHLWPIDEMQALDVLDGMRLWREANYELLEAYYACDNGDMDPCEIVMINEGLPYDEHQHREHLDSRGDVALIECADGDDWMERFKQSHFRLDESGLLVPLPLPDLKLCDDELQQTWERLRVSSEVNTYRAISAIPERHRETVLQTERNYSPWLWSY